MPKFSPASDLHTLSVLEEIYQTSPPVEPEVVSRTPKARRAIPWQRMAGPSAVALGFVGVILCLSQLTSNIRYPTSSLAKLPLPSLRDLQARAGLNFNAAATADTDNDGLTNDQEQKLGTSAYLEDTDSDSILDGDELKAGSNPLCPAGQNCGTTSAAAASASPSPVVGGQLPAPTAPVAGANLSPTQLRQLMLESGMSPELLQGFTDQQLLEVYQQVQREEASKNVPSATGLGTQNSVGSITPGNTGGAPSGQLNIPAGLDLSSITPAEMRKQLLSQGISQEVLNQITDEQLQQIMNEALIQIQNEQ